MKRILIIENDPVLRAIYRSKYDLSGFSVEAVDDAPAALVQLGAFHPHLIQMDLSLRSLRGPDLIRQIRATPGHKRTPILVLSSFYRADLIKEAFDAGADKCISKTDCTATQALEIVDRMFNFEMAGAESGTTITPAPAAALPPASGVPSPAALPAPPTAMSSSMAPSAPLLKTPALPNPVQGFPSPIPPTPSPKSSVPPPPTAPTEPSAPMVEDPFAAFAEAEAEGKDAPPIATEATSYFRRSIRQEFLMRVPQIQNDLRDRVGALVRSKNPADQLAILRAFNPTITSLVGLAGITGFSRIAHLAGAMEALLRDLQEKPQQVNTSVLRTIAHAADCLNVLFRDIHQDSPDAPQSLWILAVDDDPISRRTMSVALAKAHLRCLSIAEAQFALTILDENHFDLIFLDADMPVMNGFELCARLRKMPAHKTVPVVFVTGMTNFEVRAQSSLAGANDLIGKPFIMMELAVKALTYLLRPRPTGDTKPPVAAN